MKTIALALLLGMTPAMAALAQPPDPNQPQFALGVAVISSPEPYRGVDDDPLVVPAISFAYKRFFLRGIYAGFTLFERDGLELALVARPRFAGYEAEDSPFLAGMDDRRMSADLGFELEWAGERFGVRLTPVTDILDRSGGQEVSLDLFVPLRLGPFRIEPRLGAIWQSADSAGYYYGVRPDEDLPGRPAYEPGDSVHLTGGVFAFAPVARRLVFQGVVKAERLSGHVADSPIVEDDVGITGFAALSYQF